MRWHVPTEWFLASITVSSTTRTPHWARRSRPCSPSITRLALKCLPSKVVLQPKRGVEFPIGEWLGGPRLPAVRRLLFSDRALARGCLQRAALERAMEVHRRGYNQSHRLWCLVWLDLRHLIFIDAALGPSETIPLD